MDTKTASQPNRWWDIPAAFLLVAAILTAAIRLVATQWTAGTGELGPVETVAFLGVAAGLALGASRFSSRLSGLFSFIYGTFVITWQLGLVEGSGEIWTERIASVAQRLGLIAVDLLRDDVLTDSLLFVIVMEILFWLLALLAGYNLTRHGNAWTAVLPTGFAITIFHFFDPVQSREWYLPVYVFFALALVARVSFMHHRSRWQQTRTSLPPQLGYDFIRFAMLATGAVIVFSWTAPAMAQQLPAAARAFKPLLTRWESFTTDVENVFAPLRSSVGIRSGFYGTNVSLGLGNPLSDAQVLAVRPPGNLPDNVPLYWRGRVYDTYEKGQWRSSNSESRVLQPNEDTLPIPKERGRLPVAFTFVVADYQSTLLVPSSAIWVSRTTLVDTIPNADNSFDLVSFRASPSLAPGDAYQVRGYLSTATEWQLRNAGTTYPDWIKERYLQLPEEITERTRQLAQDVTQDLDNPYDKTLAITQYLRDNITYSQSVPGWPRDREPVDWFIFDLRAGFCNYYASAEVVLLRSLGIPARLVFGYAQGVELENGDFFVRERDAHAWPEVYFPSLGWVEFEPTVSQPVIVRVPGAPENNGATGEAGGLNPIPEELPDNPANPAGGREVTDEDEANPATGGLSPIQRTLVITVPVVVILALLVLLFGLRKRINFGFVPIAIEKTFERNGVQPPSNIRRWAQRARLPGLSRAYLEINAALERLGNHPPAGQTPNERASALTGILPETQPHAERLVHEYQMSTFAQKPADLPAAEQAGGQIRWLSIKAVLLNLLNRLRRSSVKERNRQRVKEFLDE